MADPKDEILPLEEVAAYLKAGKRTGTDLLGKLPYPPSSSEARGDFAARNWIAELRPALKRTRSKGNANAAPPHFQRFHTIHRKTPCLDLLTY